MEFTLFDYRSGQALQGVS